MTRPRHERRRRKTVSAAIVRRTRSQRGSTSTDCKPLPRNDETPLEILPAVENPKWNEIFEKSCKVRTVTHDRLGRLLSGFEKPVPRRCHQCHPRCRRLQLPPPHPLAERCCSKSSPSSRSNFSSALAEIQVLPGRLAFQFRLSNKTITCSLGSWEPRPRTGIGSFMQINCGGRKNPQSNKATSLSLRIFQ
jgi:hypothetical protein